MEVFLVGSTLQFLCYETDKVDRFVICGSADGASEIRLMARYEDAIREHGETGRREPPPLKPSDRRLFE